MVIYKKISKRTLSLLLLVLICFNTFYFDYKKADAIFVPVVEGGIALADALLYLAGLCGVAFTADYIATHPLTDERKKELVNDFNKECERQAIDQETRDKWTRELVKGTLDKASACWDAFLTSISSTHEKEVNLYSNSFGYFTTSSIINRNLSLTGSDGETYIFNGQYALSFIVDPNTNYDAFCYNFDYSSSSNNAYANFFALQIPSDCKRELIIDSSGAFLCHKENSSNFIHAKVYRYRFVLNPVNEKTGLSDIVSFTKTHEASSKSFDDLSQGRGFTWFFSLPYSVDPSFYTKYNEKPVVNQNVKNIPMLDSRPQLKSRNIFGNISSGKSLANGNVNIINPSATDINDPVSINWDNISVVGDIGAGGISGTQEGEKVISNAYEKLWEKVANGEITWEQFIEALQDGVGVIATERVPATDIPDDDTLDYVDEVVVPADPDKPEEKEKVDDIIQNNQAKGDGLTFDLRKFFPFCIPWDLYNLFSYLNAPAEAPKFEIPVPSYDTSGNLTMDNTITVDLSIFDSVALVFRVCIFIVFCLGLILITRSLIRG